MKRVARVAALILATLTAVILLWQFRTVVVLFVLSLALAAAIRPPIDYLATRGVPRGAALGLTYLLFFLSLGLLSFAFGGPLLTELQQAGDAFFANYDNVRASWSTGGLVQQLMAQRLPPSSELYAAVAGPQRSVLLQAGFGVTLSIFDMVSKFVLVVVISIYWSADQLHFERLWLSLLPGDNRTRARRIWESIEGGAGAYIRSEVVQSILAGLLLGGGYWAMGLHYPVLLALLGALAWLVPLVGAALAIIPTTMIALVQGVPVGAGAALYTLLVFVVLERQVEPRIFHRRRYNSLLVVLVMIAMADAAGLPGLLLAPPLAAAIQIFASELVSAPVPRPVLANPEPELDMLREKLVTLRRVTEAAGPELSPEVSSMVDRLASLVEEAREVLVSEPEVEKRIAPASTLPALGRVTSEVQSGDASRVR